MKELVLPKLDFPERLTVELTSCCNLECVMCPRHNLAAEAMGYMDFALFEKIIEEAKEHLPVALVPFFRGESLLHPRFFDMIGLAKKSGLAPVQLTTNAMLLDEGAAKNLVESGVDFVSFSLDVLGKESYEKIRKKGDYGRVMSNIDRFLEIRARSGKKLPEVQVSTVETEENKGGLEEFVSFWTKKVDRVRVYPEHSSDGSYGSLKGQKLPAFDRRLPCRKVFSDMVVYWNGDVAVCNHDWDRKEFIGNVKESTIGEVWNSEKYLEIRKRHMDGALESDPTCSGCDHWKMYYMDDGFIGSIHKGGNEGSDNKTDI